MKSEKKNVCQNKHHETHSNELWDLNIKSSVIFKLHVFPSAEGNNFVGDGSALSMNHLSFKSIHWRYVSQIPVNFK